MSLRETRLAAFKLCAKVASVLHIGEGMKWLAAAVLLIPLMELRAAEPLTYVILGDSTAAGIGGNYESGIAVATEKALGAQGRVTMTNLAVSGARMRDVRRLQLRDAAALRPDV